MCLMKTLIKIDGLDFETYFDYQPEEPATRCQADNTGYPGCCEKLKNISLVYNGDSYDYFLLSDEGRKFIESKIWESRENWKPCE